MEKLNKFKDSSILIHSNRYDYSLVEYVSTKNKVKIICPEHGVFEQTPEKHISRKQGCPRCSVNYKISPEEFIEKSKNIHGDKYDYSLCNYKNANSNVTIICKEHGNFEQFAKLHMSGSNCPKCFGRDKDNNDVITALKQVHGDKYDYSMVEYVSQKTPIKIKCLEHGIFEQTFNTHKKGHGCPKCVGRYKTNDDFIFDAKIIHDNKYVYSLVNYKNSMVNVDIICKIHGIFNQSPTNHLQGNGCPKCKCASISYKKTNTQDEYIIKAKAVHGFKYDYSSIEYLGNIKNITITCSEHGEFSQLASSHLQGTGCPKCGLKYDKSEGEVKDFIESIGLTYIENTKKIISPLELDIYISSHNIAIEFDGLYWHSEIHKPSNYHLNKTELCDKQGIKLIHIFEDEWRDKQDIVKSRLMNILGLTSYKIYGRKTQIREVSSKDSMCFLNNNHIQGNVNSSIKLGLYYNDELVSLMTFGKGRIVMGGDSNQYELLRFCNKLNTSVIGGADKLLKYFIKTYNPIEIISYADRRWSQGDLYDKLGFINTHNSRPNYHYIINNKRKHRFSFRKSILVKQGYNKDLTEHQIMLERKIYRIYDCGTMVYKKTLTY
jgi:hypothetical protein